MKNYQRDDIGAITLEYQRANNPQDRYASFDYCFYYFRQSSSTALLADIEKSCLVLGFYLASWGMLRGSSFLLNKSAKYYEPLIEYIAGLDKAIWEIDVDSYNKKNIETILEVYDQIRSVFIMNKSAHITLVTKIMLGVFGIIPAFDNYFGNTFRGLFTDCGFRSVNKKSLDCLRKFYEHNKDDIDTFSNQIFVTEFVSGEKSIIKYKKAKIIDMYGFTRGLNKS